MSTKIEELVFRYALNKFTQTRLQGNITYYAHYEKVSQMLHDQILEALNTTRDDEKTFRWLAQKTEKIIEQMERCAQETIRRIYSFLRTPPFTFGKPVYLHAFPESFSLILLSGNPSKI